MLSGKSEHLALIDGIGDTYASKLNDAGITTYGQMGTMSPTAILKALGVKTKSSLPYWIAQARLLAAHRDNEKEMLVDAVQSQSLAIPEFENPEDASAAAEALIRSIKTNKEDTPKKPDDAMHERHEPIVCLNMRHRNRAAQDKLRSELEFLTALENPTDRQQERILRIREILEHEVIVDRLFNKIATDLNNDVIHDGRGVLPSQQGHDPDSNLTVAEKETAGIYGILLRENVTDPNQKNFTHKLYTARGEYKESRDLFEKVTDILADEGDRANYPDEHAEELEGRFIREREIASIVSALYRQGVKHYDIHLRNIVRNQLTRFAVNDEDRPSTGIEIDLPDLEAFSDVEIIVDNLYATQAIYFAAMLEQVKMFQVRDKLVELFQLGMLPFGRGHAGDLLFRQMRQQSHRFSEYERLNIYARTFGIPGGDPGQNPNREFQTLWLRFASGVSSFARQLSLDNLLRAAIPASVSQEQVRKSGRDLAANLSLYGYGMAFFAATDLQKEINETIELLSDSEVKGAYGARDMWGVIEQVSAFELGGPQDSIRYRTMASAGAVIIRWLANKSRDLASVNTVEILDPTEIAHPRVREGSPTTNPLDSDLVNACERWLSVTGTPEEQIESFAEHSVAPNTTTRPIQMPAFARDLLDSVGVATNGV